MCILCYQFLWIVLFWLPLRYSLTFICLVHPMLPVSLDCPFLIASSVFFNVYLSVSLDCPFLTASSVFSNVYLSVSLDCPFFIASSVFSNVYLSVSLDCPLLIASSVFSNVYFNLLLFWDFALLFKLRNGLQNNTKVNARTVHTWY